MTVDLAARLNRTAWDQQAAQLLPADRPTTHGRLEWTQYPGHGPGVELLGDLHGRTAVDIGCGNADNLVVLAAAGAVCTGIDLAPHQLDRANIRWGRLPLRLLCGDARTLLATTSATIDICLSIFGAVGHCPPEQLLPVIATALNPGGLLAFSVPHPRWLGPHRSHLILPDHSQLPVVRWTATAAGWKAATEAAGLRVQHLEEITAPDGTGTCCTILLAHREAPTALRGAADTHDPRIWPVPLRVTQRRPTLGDVFDDT